MRKDVLLVVAAVALVLVSVFGTLIYMSAKKEPAAQVAELDRTRLVRLHSPTLGNADAPVVIVEFLDPACGTCRDFYPLVKQMMAANPERIRLVLRFAPFHEGSDQVVAMLVAARKQGKFWPALEALLTAQDKWVMQHKAQPALAFKQLEGLGLNLEQLRADMASPEVARIIAQDLEDVKALEVAQTPEFFVNGKPLPSFGYAQLKELVDSTLASAKR